MEDYDDASSVIPPAIRRRRRRLYAPLLLIPATALLVWVERRPIATHFIDRELAAAGVPARYAIADLGLGRQRLTGVVLGDPADPDLVADWIETRVDFGLSGPYLAAVSAGHVRLKARLADGRVSLGAIDRLLPAPSGKPFALPALPVTVARATVDLATPYGPVRLAVAGEGRLDDGFAGPIAAVAPRLAIGGCTVRGVRAAMRVAIDQARPHLAGPLRAGAVACAGSTVADPRAELELTLTAALDGWHGRAQVAAGPAGAGGTQVGRLAGSIDFDGSASVTRGTLDIAAERLRTDVGTAARLALDGVYALGSDTRFEGEARVRGATPADRWRGGLRSWRSAGTGTPLAPVTAQLATAVDAAVRNAAIDAAIRLTPDGIAITSATLAAPGGARLALTGGQGMVIGRAGLTIDGRLTTAGGGLPRAAISVSRLVPGGPVSGRATMAPYAAGSARLAATPIDFVVTPAGAFRVTTHVTLTGPLGDGQLTALRLPLAVRGDGQGALTLDPGCTPVAFQRLAVAGLVLDPAALTLCPTGTALVAMRGGRLTGGARLAATTLGGRLGATPLAVAMRGGAFDLADRGFAASGLAVRLGAPDRQTLIAADRLTGTVAGATVTGGFAGAAGRIADAPLLMSEGTGTWRLAGGALSIEAGLRVADAEAASPRFRPVDARGVSLTLRDGRIAVAGVLHEPGTGTRVADVAIDHRLATGRGHADLSIAALTFGAGFQPDLLTPLTFGVIADVNGTIDGRGRIDWSPEGVTSTGDFGTAAGTPGLDLAAAFGPAQGIAGRVRFDDLLGLHTPPAQRATIRSVNPGIAVQDGTVRYQLLGGTRVQVEGAEWPFAGGSLTLDPSLLDFDAQRSRRLTFRIAGARADQFLQQFDFDNLDATGTFDGTLPMVFDQSGGRIEDGHLAMHPGGGTIAYVGELGQKQLGIWGNLAFQALRSLRYRSLALTMNGPLAGEMVTDVRFAGVSQGRGAKSNFIVRRLQRLPFVFNVRIRAPFRGLIDSAASFYDPRRLIQRNLPALLEEQNRRVPPPVPAVPAPRPLIQPPASETVR